MIQKLRTVIAILLIFTVSSFGSIFSETQRGITTGTELSAVFATTLETKAVLTGTLTVPFLAGSGPLVAGNNVQARFGAEVSPVSVNGTCEILLTPIAFFQLIAGTSVGSAWNLPIADGLRMNRRTSNVPGDFDNAELTGSAFDGLVWSASIGGALQFDYAAVRPGEWNHIVLRTYHAARYRALTSAGDGDSWLYEGDSGENRNGWNYYGNLLVAYRMPLVLDTIGFLAESDLYLYGTADGNLWGDDLARWTFGPVANFAVTRKIAATVLVQMQTELNYIGETGKYDFYQDRRVPESDTTDIAFYRAVLKVTMKLK
jgi:hypothetical protein